MKTLRLYTHPDCQRCQRLMRFHSRFDWLGQLEHCIEAPSCGPLRMGQVVGLDLVRGQLLHGHHVMRALCRAIPAYWVFLPLLKLPVVKRHLDHQLSGCEGGACALS